MSTSGTTPAAAKPSILTSIANAPALTLVGVVLLLATWQLRLGGSTTAVGEQVGFGLPLSTLVLGAGVLTLLVRTWRRGRWQLPAFPWTLGLFLAAAALGVLGLNADNLNSAIKELVQLAEIGVGAWLLTALVERDEVSVVLDRFAEAAMILLVLAWLGDFTGWLGLSPAKLVAFLILATPLIMRRVAGHSLRVRAFMLLLGMLIALRADNGGLMLVWLGVAGLSAALMAGPRWPALAMPGLVMMLVFSYYRTAETGTGWTSLQRQYDATHVRRVYIENSAAVQAPRYFPLGGGLGAYKSTINQLRLHIPLLPHPNENKIAPDSNCQYLLTLVESGLPAAVLLLVALLAAVWRSFGAAAANPVKPQAGNATTATDTTDDEADETDDEDRPVAVTAATVAPAPVAVDAVVDPQQRLDALAVGIALIGVIGAGLFCTILSRGLGIWVGALIGLSSVLAAKAAASQAASVAAPLAGTRTERATQALGGLLARLALPAVVASLALTGMVMLNRTYDPTTRLSAANQQVRALFGPGSDAGITGAGAGRTPGGLEIVSLDNAANELVLRVEGESYTEATGHFNRAAANDASGHEVLEIPLHSGKALGEALYTVNVPKAGTWSLSARVWWSDGCANSIGITVAETLHMLSSERFATWHELTSVNPAILPAGPVQVRVRNLEDGIRLDYFTLRYLGPAPSTLPASATATTAGTKAAAIP